ncbi:MAG: hypothetical protein ABL949_10260 [Fimbriimonadaceae bacterium]
MDWESLGQNPGLGTRIAVIGGNMRDSLLPGIIEAGFKSMNIPFDLHCLQVGAERFPDCISHLRSIGFRGGAVASPHKVEAARLAEKYFQNRFAMGVANALSFEDRGVFGQNTECPAIVSLVQNIEPATALVMGAGSGARSVVAALLDSGWKVRLWNRNGIRARMMQNTMTRFGKVDILAQPEPTGCTLVVNATNLGARAGEKPPVDWGRAPRTTTAMDLVYRRVPTEMLREAKVRGFTTIDGRALVVEKAALSIEWWMERPVDRAPMLEAAGLRVLDVGL